jgi:hypothetical protein
LRGDRAYPLGRSSRSRAGKKRRSPTTSRQCDARSRQREFGWFSMRTGQRRVFSARTQSPSWQATRLPRCCEALGDSPSRQDMRHWVTDNQAAEKVTCRSATARQSRARNLLTRAKPLISLAGALRFRGSRARSCARNHAMIARFRGFCRTSRPLPRHAAVSPFHVGPCLIRADWREKGSPRRANSPRGCTACNVTGRSYAVRLQQAFSIRSPRYILQQPHDDSDTVLHINKIPQ